MRKLVFVLLLFTGCIATGHLTTPSGKPEVTVRADKKKITEACAAWLIQNGYEIDKQTDFNIVGMMNTSNGWSRALTDKEFYVKETFSFAPKGDAITVYGAKTKVEKNNVGGIAENAMDTQDQYEEIQKSLEQIATMVK